MYMLSTVGYPRIGAHRELKRWTEAYFAGKLDRSALLENASRLRKENWQIQKEKGISLIPSNDFSFYDAMLDTAAMLGVVPDVYRDLKLNAPDTYYAMAKGYQGPRGDVKALPMRKWFNTNYHYIVPFIEGDTNFRLENTKITDEYREALSIGIGTKPVLIGPFTFFKLSRLSPEICIEDAAYRAVDVYCEVFRRLDRLGVEFVQLDEPALAADLEWRDIDLFKTLYHKLLPSKGSLKILLQTYFGDIRDIYEDVAAMDFDGIGLDFVEGTQSAELVRRIGFPKNKVLVAGVVNGRNVWRNDYEKTMPLLEKLAKAVSPGKLALGTSCSLLHLPYTVRSETKLNPECARHLAFAEEKLDELNDLAGLSAGADYRNDPVYLSNALLHRERAATPGVVDPDVRGRTAMISETDLSRSMPFEQRTALQKEKLRLPPLPTTTIGSFPQTADVKELRARWRKGAIDVERYKQGIFDKIESLVRLQEQLGLDVLVHGEYERADMVEYFGENLDGFLFTQEGWVQSYGTRCVKPPIIFGDVSRPDPITVQYIAYAQSLTSKPVKGMLTGPVTILNWSFPREDLPLRDIAMQIALAMRDEVLDLERGGIPIIQIDEAALREKLPLRRGDWHAAYLDWAISAFRLTHSGVRPDTQIHTHMCYSEFADIVQEIDDMDADVISFEAARSNLSILDVLKECNFRTQTGIGVYDIHSPRIPSVEEMAGILRKVVEKLGREKVWVNPDCGLKTRGLEETVSSLKNMVAAAHIARDDA